MPGNCALSLESTVLRYSFEAHFVYLNGTQRKGDKYGGGYESFQFRLWRRDGTLHCDSLRCVGGSRKTQSHTGAVRFGHSQCAWSSLCPHWLCPHTHDRRKFSHHRRGSGKEYFRSWAHRSETVGRVRLQHVLLRRRLRQSGRLYAARPAPLRSGIFEEPRWQSPFLSFHSARSLSRHRRTTWPRRSCSPRVSGFLDTHYHRKTFWPGLGLRKRIESHRSKCLRRKAGLSHRSLPW